MNQVIETFCLTLLHSVWQAGLLFIIYGVFRKSVLKQGHPVEKRNLLLILLASQLLMFVATFLVLQFATPVQQTNWVQQTIAGVKRSTLLTTTSFIVYSLVVVFKSGSLLHQWYRFKLMASDRESAPAELRLFVDVRRREIGISRKISVWLSRNITTPLTYGWLKPVILLPVVLVNQLSQEEVETLILHELAHISSKDYLLNFLVIVSETLFFFNPFILLLAREIKKEREKNCDQQVIQFEYSPLLYAGTLLKAARFQQAAPRLSLNAVSDKSSLMERIKLITAEGKLPSKRINPGAYAFLALMLVVAGLFTASSLKTQQPAAIAGLTESYAPNEVFSFVKEAYMDEKKGKVLETVPVKEPVSEQQLCDVPAKPSPSPEKKRVPSPVYVKADEQTILNNKFFTIPVSGKELIEKEVEITEEDPQTGIITTTGVRMTWTDSGWVAEPLWQTRLKKEEAALKADSTGFEGPVPFYELQ